MVRWRKSSYSQQQEGLCVETAALEAGAVGIRDSKNPDAGHLTVSKAMFGALLTQVKSGSLDL